MTTVLQVSDLSIGAARMFGSSPRSGHVEIVVAIAAEREWRQHGTAKVRQLTCHPSTGHSMIMSNSSAP